MIKIVDNVDLKKLEKILKKYNLKYVYSCDEDTGESFISGIRTKDILEVVHFMPKVRKIEYYFTLNKSGKLCSCNNFKHHEDLLYDLTKADLVEQVDE